MPIYEEKEINQEFLKWHKRGIYDFHGKWGDEPVIEYRHNTKEGCFNLKRVKTKILLPGMNRLEYQDMDET